MPCTQFTDALTRYAAGDTVTPPVTAHLDTCPDCRAYLDAERRTLAMVDAELREVLSIEPAPHLAARLHARATVSASGSPRSMRRWWVPALAVAAVLALFVWTSIRWSVAPATDAARVADAGLPSSEAGSRPAGTPGATLVEGRPAGTPGTTVVEGGKPANFNSTELVERNVRESVKSVDHRSMQSMGNQRAKTLEPEVLVPSDQRVAIRRLMASLREGLIDGSALAVPVTEESTTVVAPLDLQITPLTIDLLTVGAPHEATPPPSTPPHAAER